MKRYTLYPLAAIIVMLAASFCANSANAAGCLDKKCGSRSSVCCPNCSCKCYTCNLEAEMVDVEKKCFEVENDVICIPKVVFPWQRGKKLCNLGRRCGSSCDNCDSCGGAGCSTCVHNGAKIRKIKKLKTKKYECPECEYTWTAEEKPASPCCGGGCGCGGSSKCDGGCCDAMVVPSAPMEYYTTPMAAPVVADPASQQYGSQDYHSQSSEVIQAPVVDQVPDAPESNFDLQSYEEDEGGLQPVTIEELH